MTGAPALAASLAVLIDGVTESEGKRFQVSADLLDQAAGFGSVSSRSVVTEDGHLLVTANFSYVSLAAWALDSWRTTLRSQLPGFASVRLVLSATDEAECNGPTFGDEVTFALLDQCPDGHCNVSEVAAAVAGPMLLAFGRLLFVKRINVGTISQRVYRLSSDHLPERSRLDWAHRNLGVPSPEVQRILSELRASDAEHEAPSAVIVFIGDAEETALAVSDYVLERHAQGAVVIRLFDSTLYPAGLRPSIGGERPPTQLHWPLPASFNSEDSDELDRCCAMVSTACGDAPVIVCLPWRFDLPSVVSVVERLKFRHRDHQVKVLVAVELEQGDVVDPALIALADLTVSSYGSQYSCPVGDRQ